MAPCTTPNLMPTYSESSPLEATTKRNALSDRYVVALKELVGLGAHPYSPKNVREAISCQLSLSIPQRRALEMFNMTTFLAVCAH